MFVLWKASNFCYSAGQRAFPRGSESVSVRFLSVVFRQIGAGTASIVQSPRILYWQGARSRTARCFPLCACPAGHCRSDEYTSLMGEYSARQSPFRAVLSEFSPARRLQHCLCHYSVTTQTVPVAFCRTSYWLKCNVAAGSGPPGKLTFDACPDRKMQPCGRRGSGSCIQTEIFQ